MPRVERVCQVCETVFQIPPCRVQNGQGKFCSKACRMQGRLLGLTVGGAHRTKYQWEPWMDALVLEHYDSQPATLDWLLTQIRFPRPIITARAGRLGVARQRAPQWTDAEIDYVHSHLGHERIAVMARTLGRSPEGVRQLARRRGINKTTSGGYTARALERLLGWHKPRTKALVDRGWLQATRRQMDYTRSWQDPYLITDDALYRCLIAHPELIDLRRVSKDWFLDLISKGAFTKARLRESRSA